jgi:hypothetical protein
MYRSTWSRKLAAAAVGAAVACGAAAGARAADDGGVPTLSASDFTFTLSRIDSASGGTAVLTPDELATYFSTARCACPTSVLAGLAISSDAAANLGSHTVDAQLMVGNDCDNVSATACVAVGASLSLSASKQLSTSSMTTSSIFSAAGRSDCAAGSTSSTRLWAIVRLDGARLATEPSLALTLGGDGPKAPTEVKTLTADQGLLISWKATGDSTALQGHQVLCAPGPSSPATAAYDLCPAALPDGGAGPFASYDPQFVCSGLVAVGTNQVRVHGLENGRTYQVAVVAVGIDGTPSAPSAIVEGIPSPTVGFEDLYKQGGGTAAAGCATGGRGAPGGAGALAVAAGALLIALALWRGRRGPGAIAIVVGAGIALGAAAEARADSGGSSLPFTARADWATAPPPSSRAWNVELRFAPYRPNVDDEFADRGLPDRPFAAIFGNARRLMTQLEIDRHLLHRGGTWALGVSAGYYRVTAASLSADLQTRTGDETALRLIPLSAAIVYRADMLRERYGSPVVPYAKVGLDCTLWQMSDTSQASASGRTFGWHSAAGVTLNLSFIDPESAQSMDREAGVNQTAVFFEVVRYDIAGFGSDSALHVGDTTWFAGLMLEL